MGKNGVNAILNLANQKHLIDITPRNLGREFDFADFSAINLALEEMYGLAAGVVWRCAPGVQASRRLEELRRSGRGKATWLSKCCH